MRSTDLPLALTEQKERKISASLEDLKAIEGIEDSIANKIYNYFHE